MKLRNRIVRTLPAITLVCGLLPAPAEAQFVQQVKLVDTSDTEQGYSLSLSGDGNTAIVGALGFALVYTRSSGAWSQQATLVGADAIGTADQGRSVSLSGDGNTAIVGGPADNASAGAAWVYTRSGGVWSQQAKLVGTGAIGPASQGVSVSLSGDGNTAIVGGSTDNNYAGAAWVFTRSGGIWSQQGKLVGTGVVGTFGAVQGWSVALSGDGNTAIVGGPSDNNEVGAAWVYTRSGGWSQQAKLVGTNAIGTADQGISVSLSGDGNTAIVGGSYDHDLAGAAWVFTRSGGIWSQQGAKLVGTNAIGTADQGRSVSLSLDGNTAIIGGPADNANAGAAWVYTRSRGVWSQQPKLVGTDAIGGAEQGFSVSLSGDGKTAIVGGPIDNGGRTGAAWVYAAPVFAGTPGKANCHGKSVSALARQFGGLNAAAAALGLPGVPALQDAILAFCER